MSEEAFNFKDANWDGNDAVVAEVATQETASVEPPTQDVIPLIESTPILDAVPPSQEVKPIKEEESAPVMDYQTAWNVIKKEKGIEVDDIDELLKPKEEKNFSPQMEAFDDYIKKTGDDNYNNFLETQKDWSTVDASEKVRNWLKLSNPSLTDKEVDFQYEEDYGTTDLDADDDEREINKRNIKLKIDSEKANEFFNNRKEQFNVVGGSDKFIPNEYKEAKAFYDNLEKGKQEYQDTLQKVGAINLSKANSIFNNEFKGFEFDVKNEEEVVDKILYKPEDFEQAKAFHSDLSNLEKLFFNENGEIINEKDFFIFSEIARVGASKFVEHICNTATANLIERQDKKSKNIVDNNASSNNPALANKKGINWGSIPN